MSDQDGIRSVSADSQQWFDQAPKVVDALKRGSSVSITTWGGRELLGSICDREQTGLLLDVRAAEGGAGGYVFLPWSSIEQVVIREVSQRRASFCRARAEQAVRRADNNAGVLSGRTPPRG